jgi:hypothetical protein
MSHFSVLEQFACLQESTPESWYASQIVELLA